jgi:adenylyltransferase/sulfurtransferase
VGQIGTAKVDAAAEAVQRLNPGVRFEGIQRRIGADDVETLLADLAPHAILDGSDNFATRLAVADAALRLRIPLVSAAVAEFEGQLGVFRGWEADKPCYRCFVGADPERPEATCSARLPE